MQRINRFIRRLSEAQWLETVKLTEWEIEESIYLLPGDYKRVETTAKSLEALKGGYGTTYWIRGKVQVPEHWGYQPRGLVVRGGGEGLVRVNGLSHHGIDRNHEYVPLPAAQRNYDVEIELYDPIPEPVDSLNRLSQRPPQVTSLEIGLAARNEAVQSLLYRMTVLAEAAMQLPAGDIRRMRLEQALLAAMDDVGGIASFDPSKAAAAEQKLIAAGSAYEAESDGTGTMHMVGQSHIDVAWLWPVRETMWKVIRTFSTACSLIEEYPDFTYTQSQPQLYQFVKRDDPQLYARIKEKIAEGRWEIVGGMWVEPDLNLPSGESLARQLLYGQRFYLQEFGRISDIEWLPDTFGYCASLPQLLKRAGIRRFMTSKLNWNDTNVFPYDLFHWVGIDGTSVLSYLNHGLNEHTKAKDLHEHWASFRQKDRARDQMLLYGHGDGGGGVTREMVEYVRRSEGLPALPKVQFSTASRFFKQVEERADVLPKWHGDLYLELHRGTYTTQARNKKHNRKAEGLYRDAELWYSLAGREDLADQELLHEGWKLLLLNQFHDIIPGTSIPEVYETSEREYRTIFGHGQQVLERALNAIASQVKLVGEGRPMIVFNSLGWEREDTLRLKGGAELLRTKVFDEAGKPLLADVLHNREQNEYELFIHMPAVPAFGYTAIWLREEATDEAHPQSASDTAELEDSWETEYYRLQFNDNGEIISWYDKKADRELIPTGKAANELQLFRDEPLHYDAWDIDPRFDEQRAESAILLEKKVEHRGKVCDVLYFSWQLGNSRAVQRMIVYHHRRRVDFETRVDWKEEHKLLKAAFPVDVLSSKATYEIPFGAIERPTHNNTSWEQAQFEVCGHRWVDLSEGGYGVSLLNDCKYGYDVKEGTLRLSLLRAPKWPDKEADRGMHSFTYSLYPHEGDWRESRVVRRAAELNLPLRGKAAARNARGERSATSAFMSMQSKHVVLETIKPAEDEGGGIVLRLYESSGSKERVHLKLPADIQEVVETDLLEREICKLPVNQGEIELTFGPFEIKTICLKK